MPNVYGIVHQYDALLIFYVTRVARKYTNVSYLYSNRLTEE